MVQNRVSLIDDTRRAYEEISSRVFERCKTQCFLLGSCCDDKYCEIAQKWAYDEWGITLDPVIVDPVSFLLPNKICKVEPYLRPLCSVHICERLLFDDARFSKWYFSMRERIEELEWERCGGIL